MNFPKPTQKQLAREVWGRNFEIGVFGRRPFIEDLRAEVGEILTRSRALWPGDHGQVELRVETWGVAFQGSLVDCYALNLGSALASRIVIRLPDLRSGAREELFANARRLPWELWLPSRAGAEAWLEIRVHMENSRIHHSGLAEQALRDAIVARLGGSANPAAANAPPQTQPQRLYLHSQGARSTVSLDTSGGRLYHRSWRTISGPAPLSEQLAAGLVRRAAALLPNPAWVLDPMCGSGTFRFEAALLLAAALPGVARSFAFQDWPNFRPGHFDHLRKHLGTKPAAGPLPIFSSDIDEASVAAARSNSTRFGEATGIQLPVPTKRDFAEVRAPRSRPGWVLLNPPYNQRLQAGVDLPKRIAAWLGDLPTGTVLVLLVPDVESAACKTLFAALARQTAELRLDNGGIAASALILVKT